MEQNAHEGRNFKRTKRSTFWTPLSGSAVVIRFPISSFPFVTETPLCIRMAHDYFAGTTIQLPPSDLHLPIDTNGSTNS
jgi:hypothetical protein